MLSVWPSGGGRQVLEGEVREERRREEVGGGRRRGLELGRVSGLHCFGGGDDTNSRRSKRPVGRKEEGGKEEEMERREEGTVSSHTSRSKGFPPLSCSQLTSLRWTYLVK